MNDKARKNEVKELLTDNQKIRTTDLFVPFWKLGITIKAILILSNEMLPSLHEIKDKNNINGQGHGLWMPRETIAFTAWPIIHSHSQIFS